MAEEQIPGIEGEYAFSVRIQTGNKVAFQGPMRSRSFEPALNGEISGPKLQGRVVPQSGADFSSDGILDGRLMLQASDGAWIYMEQCGYEHSETEDGSPYFRVTPYFDTPVGPHDWLSKTVFIGIGERQTDPGQVLIHYYEII